VTQIFEEGGADFNRVTPAAKLDGDGLHAHRIGISGRVSKFDHLFYGAVIVLKKLAKILVGEQKETEETRMLMAVNNLSTHRKPLLIKAIL
jgi:hypothetical protein